MDYKIDRPVQVVDGKSYYTAPGSGEYLGMVYESKRNSLMSCACKECGQDIVAFAGEIESGQAGCPACSSGVALLSGPEAEWFHISQSGSLFGNLKLTASICSATFQPLWTLDSEEAFALYLRADFDRVTAIQLVVERCREQARSMGRAPGDGSMVFISVAPGNPREEERVIESWTGPGRYVVVERYWGKSQNEELWHWNTISEDAVCADIYDLGELVAGLGFYEPMLGEDGIVFIDKIGGN